MSITLIAAVAKNNVIGNSKLDTMPWHCTQELQFFKKTTMGKTLIMGRKTAEQVGKLPGRDAIVLSKDPDYKLPGFTTYTLKQLIAEKDTAEFMCCGGAEIYTALLPYVDTTIVSYMNFDAEGDIYLPNVDSMDWYIDNIDTHDEFTVVARLRYEKN